MLCPNCGETAVSVMTSYGVRNSCEKCNLRSWGDKPLVDTKTINARVEAHEIFDRLWRQKFMTRTEAYAWLREELGYEKTPHMAEMNHEQATKVVEVATQKLLQCLKEKDSH